MPVLCRCEGHTKTLRQSKNVYTHFTRPLGGKNSSSVCGIKTCQNIGLILLTEDAAKAHQEGERTYRYPTFATKVRVTDELQKIDELK